jgi:UDP-N-acetylmuramoyl-tripeptide--D-alanyl-D-alanine ligase
VTPKPRRGATRSRTGGSSAKAASSARPFALAAADIAALAGGAVVHGDPAALVRGAAIDSRELEPGMLFVALRGEHTDGHRFVGEALRLGAGAALVSDDVPGVPGGSVLIRTGDTLRGLQRVARGVRDRRPLRVVGITGSVGKTSNKEMSALVLAERYETARSPENWNTEIGVPLVLVNLPDAAEVAVIEMAMRGPGQIRELVGIAGPDIGIVTAVGESHMDFFESREQLAAAKGELIEGLPADGAAVLNADDPLVLGLARRGPARVVTFGFRDADVTARDIRARPGQGSTFMLRIPEGEARVTLAVPGRHAVQNALGAAAVGAVLGVPADAIARGLGRARAVAQRLQVARVAGVTLINDVYNSSPRSMAAALDVMDELPGRPRIAVLGDMRELGALSLEAHRQVGREVARRRVDVLIALGPLAAEMAAAAGEAGTPRVVHTLDPMEALAALRREMAPGAVVLVKGSRALEMERIVDGLTASAAGAAGPEASQRAG